MAAKRLVCLGRSSGAFGLKGELRVFSYAEDPRLFTNAENVLIGADPQNAKPFKVISYKPHGQRLLLVLEGLTSREQADALKGQWLYVDQEVLPELPDDEYYWHQAVGCRVFHQDGRFVGTLMQVSNAGAHDLWLIRGENGQEALFPVIDGFLVSMDLDDRRVVIAPPPGLFSAQDFWEREQGGQEARDQP